MRFELTTFYRQSLLSIIPCVAVVALIAVLLSFWSYLGLLLAVALIALTVFVSKQKAASPSVLLLIFSAGTFAWIIFLDSHQVSDFGVYFRCGNEFASPWISLSDWSRKCESAWLPGFATYWRRSLLYALPMAWLANGSYLAFKVMNAVLHIATIALLYRGVNKEFGQTAGIFSASLLAIYPEFWFVTTVVSTDNLTVLLLVGFIFALAKMSAGQSAYQKILLTVLLLAALDLLRSIGPILIVGILFILPLSEKAARLALIKTVVWSVIVIFAVGFLFSLLGMTTTQTNGLLAMLVGSGLTHSRSFEEAYSWHQYVFPLLHIDHRTNLLTGWMAQDLRTVFSLPSIWFQKIGLLFGGEGYYFFAASGPLGSPDDVVLANTKPAIQFFPNWAAAMRGITAFCLLAAGLGAMKIQQHPLARASIAIGSAFLLFIILLGEVQARYSLLIAPALCIAAAGMTVMRPVGTIQSLRDGVKNVLITLALLMTSMLLIRAWANDYVAQAPLFTWTNKAVGFPECQNTNGLQIESHRITLSLQGNRCHMFSMIAKNVNESFTFYIIREPVPPKWKQELYPVIDLTFIAHHHDGTVNTLYKQFSSKEIVLPITISSQGLVSLDILIQTDSKTDKKISLAYFHEKNKVINNR